MKKFLLLFLGLTAVLTAGVTYATTVEKYQVTYLTNGGKYIHQTAKEINQKIEAAEEPLNMIVLGDSTGNSTDEWVYQFGLSFATIADKYQVHYRLWNDTTQSYEQSVNLGWGEQGDSYIVTGEFEKQVRLQHHNGLAISSDLEIMAKIKPNSWTLENPSHEQIIVIKSGLDGNRGFALRLNNEGKLSFWHSSNGSDTNVKYATASVQSVTPSDGPVWVKATLDIDNGSNGYTVSFFSSLDGKTWLPNGSPSVTSGTTQVFPSTADFIFGSRGTNGNLRGNLYEVLVKNETGKIILDMDLSNAKEDSTLFKDFEGNTYVIENEPVLYAGAPTLNILNASHPGANIAYHTNVDRFDKIVSSTFDLTFINLGHNDGSTADFKNSYSLLIQKLLDKNAQTKLVIMTQNPQVSPKTENQILKHEDITKTIGTIASDNNYGYIDVYSVLKENTQDYISSDGVHTTTEGSQAWRDVVLNFFQEKNKLDLVYQSNKLVKTPSNPVRTGYVFSGWYKDIDLTQKFNFETDYLTENIDLYAKWLPQNSNGGGLLPNLTDDDKGAIVFVVAGIFIVGLSTIYLIRPKKKGKR